MRTQYHPFHWATLMRGLEILEEWPLTWADMLAYSQAKKMDNQNLLLKIQDLINNFHPNFPPN